MVSLPSRSTITLLRSCEVKNCSRFAAVSAPISSGVCTTTTSPKTSVGSFMIGRLGKCWRQGCGGNVLARQHRLDAGEQLARAERLGHQAPNAVTLPKLFWRQFKAFGAKHDDRQIGRRGRLADALCQAQAAQS